MVDDEPWSSGLGRKLTTEWLWVQILAWMVYAIWLLLHWKKAAKWGTAKKKS